MKKRKNDNIVKDARENIGMEDSDDAHHKRDSSVNMFTLGFLLFTILTAVYVNMEKENPQTDVKTTTNRSEAIKKNYTEEKLIVSLPTTAKVKNETAKKKKKKDTFTNSYDKNIISKLSEGDKLYEQKKYPECISYFEKLHNKYSLSPRAIYGKALCLEKLSEIQRSNEMLLKAVFAYGEVAKQPKITSKLLKLSLITQAKKYIFLGQSRKAIASLSDLHQRLPNETDVMNELGIAYMIAGANKQAYPIFQKVLNLDPKNGVANSHVGFILKMDSKYKECIPYLLAGVRSGAIGADDSKFYFHLGDAYSRLHQNTKAWEIYQEAATKKIFPSAEQRSIYNAQTKLRAQPWWTKEETGYGEQFRLLERHWTTIRDEGLSLLNKEKTAFPLETENLIEKGDWRQFELYNQGRKETKNCAKTPKTCELLMKMADTTSNQRGQIKFSIMQPGTHVWPHTGPTNCRLRSHLGLVIPKDVYIRAGNETRTWQNGKVIVFDDSFDHEVWHNGTQARMILIIDFWHPDVPQWEKKTLRPI